MTVDLTGIAVSLIGVVGTIMSIVITAVINARMGDKQAAATLSAALENSLGAAQQAASGVVVSTHPQIFIPGVPSSAAVAVQYVLDHAGAEAARFGITPQGIAEKINARIGLASIAANLAVAASPTPLVPDPLGPVPLRGPNPAPLPAVPRSA
jgi:hypothetical protein